MEAVRDTKHGAACAEEILKYKLSQGGEISPASDYSLFNLRCTFFWTAYRSNSLPFVEDTAHSMYSEKPYHNSPFRPECIHHALQLSPSTLLPAYPAPVRKVLLWKETVAVDVHRHLFVITVI